MKSRGNLTIAYERVADSSFFRGYLIDKNWYFLILNKKIIPCASQTYIANVAFMAAAVAKRD